MRTFYKNLGFQNIKLKMFSSIFFVILKSNAQRIDFSFGSVFGTLENQQEASFIQISENNQEKINVERFYGIPYALPPISENRWKSPSLLDQTNFQQNFRNFNSTLTDKFRTPGKVLITENLKIFKSNEQK